MKNDISSDKPINRVKEALDEWNRHLKNSGVDLSFGQSPQGRRHLLEIYDQIRLKFQHTQDPSEKIALVHIQAKQKALMKEMPFLQRQWYQLNRQWVAKRAVNEFNEIRSSSMKELEKQIGQLGFPMVIDKLRENVRLGLPTFILQHSEQLGENIKANFGLQVNMDHEGKIMLARCRADVHDSDHGERWNKTFEAIHGQFFTKKEMSNLLSGVPVKLVHQGTGNELGGRPQEVVYKLDFKNLYGGECGLKEFHSNDQPSAPLKSELQPGQGKQNVPASETVKTIPTMISLLNGTDVTVAQSVSAHAQQVALGDEPKHSRVITLDKSKRKQRTGKKMG